MSEDDGPRQKLRTTTDSPCVFSRGDVVAIGMSASRGDVVAIGMSASRGDVAAIGMSANRFDFARVENNISKNKFEITYLKK